VLREVEERDLELVHFQTHLSMCGTGEAAALEALKRRGRRVFVTFHSVCGAWPRPDVVGMLHEIDRVLVHTPEARDRLRRIGVDANVTILPLGGPAPGLPVSAASVREGLALRSAPIVGTYGFLRPHKGLLELVEAVSRLKRRFPRIFLLAVTALHSSSESSEYHRRCRNAIARHDLTEHCGVITDFLPPGESLTALQACDVIALPYQRTVDSSSGAVRLALAAGRPVLTTTAPIFADVADCVFQVSRSTPRALARGLRMLLEDGERSRDQIERATRRMAETSLPVVGRTYAKLVVAACRDLSAFTRPYPIGDSRRDTPVPSRARCLSTVES
jgi:glycosyltransferase involved in cell wall biosynthesis